MTPSCPLSLLCLQVSSTPNLIALISQLNMGRQKKDNSHPFWGRIRGISVRGERRDTGGEKDCPVVVVVGRGGSGLITIGAKMFVKVSMSKIYLRSYCHSHSLSSKHPQNKFWLTLHRSLPHSDIRSLLSAMTHSSEQLDEVEQVTWVIRLGECEALTVAH